MKDILATFSIILFAVLLRLFPHVPNFAPVGAMALFGGVYIGRRYAMMLVLLVLLISDYLLLYVHPFSSQLLTISHFYSPVALIHTTTLYVYGSFLLTVGIGMFLKKHTSVENVILASITSSLVFFFITNFGVWVAGSYSRNIAGLWESYIMGLPFLRATVFGDLFYTGIFFGGYELVKKYVSRESFAKTL